MRRTTLFVMVLMLAVVFSASAQMRGGAVGPRGGGSFEEVELAGRLRLAANELPVLISGGQEYTLRIPPALSAEFSVSNGQQATVSGYLIERASFDLLGTQRVVMVRAIEVGGTRYVMPVGTAGRQMMGDRGSPRSRGGRR